MVPIPTSPKIAVIGLGYVGMPLALEFSKHFPVVGFDIKTARVDELNRGEDATKEAEPADIQMALERGIIFSANKADLDSCNVYFVTVPTPINEFKSPDLTPLIKASEMLGSVLRKEIGRAHV